MLPRLLSLAIFVIGTAVACGDDDATPDGSASGSDAALDAAAFDGPATDAPSPCATYCACMAATCAIYLPTGDCLSQCAALTDTQLSCRTYHCSVAQNPGPTAVHCPHAVGDPNDPTTPAECK